MKKAAALRRHPHPAREGSGDGWQAALFWLVLSAAVVAVWVWVPVH